MIQFRTLRIRTILFSIRMEEGEKVREGQRL
jgi:hypothetical protein